MSDESYTRRQQALITATEIACWVYCPEQWRLEYGLGLEAANRKEREAGKRHHAHRAAAERVAGGAIAWRRFLLLIAVAALLLWLLSRR